jgi:hypothetical protein
LVEVDFDFFCEADFFFFEDVDFFEVELFLLLLFLFLADDDEVEPCFEDFFLVVEVVSVLGCDWLFCFFCETESNGRSSRSDASRIVRNLDTAMYGWLNYELSLSLI